MQNLIFDEHGYLVPSEKITIDLATLEQVFVKDFPNSETRKDLFDNYLRYIDTFAKEITPNFTQWINGSFVTKKEDPKDIDFVTFIEAQYYLKNDEDETLDSFFAWNKYGLDAYIVGEYPRNAQKYIDHTLHFKTQWNNLFSRTRAVNERVYAKGFLEIHF